MRRTHSASLKRVCKNDASCKQDKAREDELPVKKALIMPFRGEISVDISVVHAMPERKAYRSLCETPEGVYCA